MKLSDYVIDVLVREYGVTDIFLVSGGAIMHLLDSVGSHPGVQYHAAFHEQAAVVAAEGFARRSGRLGVALVTVGPGASNAVAGLPSAWVNSIPLLVMTGQVRSDLIADYSRQRNYGPQEANTLAMAQPVTKYAASVRDPRMVRKHIDEAIHTARSGRPGPVWLEFPVDIQAAEIDENHLEVWQAPVAVKPDVQTMAQNVLELLKASERPLILPGNGVRLAEAMGELATLLQITKLPAVLALTGKDLLPEHDANLVGVFGTAGQRRANFALQNADLVLALGAGLNVEKCGFNISGFAGKAKKIIVEIDEAQLYLGAIKADVPILADVKPFLEELNRLLRSEKLAPKTKWVEACHHWKKRYPVITEDYYADKKFVSSYAFMDKLADILQPGDTLVPAAGLDVVCAYQAFRAKKDQRVFIGGWGSMGWELPLSIGASWAANKGRVITVVGDGSIQWNIQELQTIRLAQLPIKIFIFNNSGFSSIRATQRTFFEGRFVGAEPSSGVDNPHFNKLAEAYDLGYCQIHTNDELVDGISAFLADNKPGICEVYLSPDQAISPKASAFKREDGTLESRPLHDMAPFLSREEVEENMSLFDTARSS